jgi:hypothetical protein
VDFLGKKDYALLTKVFFSINNEILQFYQRVSEPKYLERVSEAKKLNTLGLLDLTLGYFGLIYARLVHLQDTEPLYNETITNFNEIFNANLAYWIVSLNDNSNFNNLTIYCSSVNLIKSFITFADKCSFEFDIKLYTM